MEEDVSNRTVTVLVILTIVISLLSTLSVMSAFSNIKQFEQPTKTTTQGQVALKIVTGDEIEKDSQPESIKKPSPTGYVALNVNPPDILLT